MRHDFSPMYTIIESTYIRLARIELYWKSPLEKCPRVHGKRYKENLMTPFDLIYTPFYDTL